MLSREYYKTSNNSFFYRTPLLAASKSRQFHTSVLPQSILVYNNFYMNRLLFSVNQIIRQSATFVTIIQCLIRLRFERYFSHHRATLFEERIHNNHVIRDRLKNSIEQLKGKILESITPEEFHLVEKIHENSYKNSFELKNKRHIRKFNELISKNKVTQTTTNITDKEK